MGLNFVPRPPREELDPPNIFITASLGLDKDPNYYQFGIHEIMEYEKELLDKIEEDYKRIKFIDQ